MVREHFWFAEKWLGTTALAGMQENKNANQKTERQMRNRHTDKKTGSKYIAK